MWVARRCWGDVGVDSGGAEGVGEPWLGEVGFEAGCPAKRVLLRRVASPLEASRPRASVQVQERSRQALRAQGAAQPALLPVFSGNPRRMWLAKQRAIARADKAACGKESLNQEVPVAEVNASPW